MSRHVENFIHLTREMTYSGGHKKYFLQACYLNIYLKKNIVTVRQRQCLSNTCQMVESADGQ